MDKKVLLRLLSHKVKEIETFLDTLHQSGIVHDIEIDILLSKIRTVYDDVKLLAASDSPEIRNEEPQVSEAIPPANTQVTSQASGQLPTQSVENPEPEIVPEPEVIPEPVIVSEPEIAPEAEIIPKPEVIHEPESLQEVKNDNSVNSNRFAISGEHSDKRLSGVKMQAVEDIMVAIGLNDRFLFIRELFNNDSALFSATVNVLNEKENWGNALAYLNEKFSWDSEDPTLVLFLGFVRRRFV